jgi:hypothetical protein
MILPILNLYEQFNIKELGGGEFLSPPPSIIAKHFIWILLSIVFF